MKKLLQLGLVLSLCLSAQLFAGEETTKDKFLAPLHIGLSGNHMTLSWSGSPSPDVNNVKDLDVKIFAYHVERKALSLKTKESSAPNRELSVTANKDGVIAIDITDGDKTIDFTQTAGGVSLTFFAANKGSWKAADFKQLLRREAEQVQVLLLRPLSEMGVSIEPSQDFPVVMALATTGFSEGDAKTAEKVDDLIKKLSAGGEAAKETTRELIKLFPLAITHITQAADKAENPEVKTALQQVIAAHPTIAAWRPYVEKNKLHEDRKYLLSIMADVPHFKAAARARLAILFGKDYGAEVADWPKQ